MFTDAVKKYFKKTIKFIFLFIFISLIILFILFFTIAKSGMCATSDLVEFKSPSGNKIVTRSLFDCGATTDFTTTVELKNGGFHKAILSLKSAHENDLGINWIDDNNIVINYTGDPELMYGYENEVLGVNIKYMNNGKALEFKCTYYECEEISRKKEIQSRKEWCNYSKENRAYCDSPDQKGYETCEDGSWCHYNGPNK